MENQEIRLVISEIEYKISTKIAWKDLSKIRKMIHVDGRDFRETFAKFLWDKMLCEAEEKPSVDEILENDNCLQNCLSKFIDSDDELKDYFESFASSTESYEAFFLAINQKYEVKLTELVDGLPKIDLEAYDGLVAGMSSLGTALINVLASDAMKNLGKMIQSFSETVGRITARIAEMIKNIKIPTVSEERKEELRLSYQNWGKFGWTLMPDAPIFGLDECPMDIKEANRIALKYCGSDAMQRLFDILRKMKGIKKSDLEEAIFCFENKKYKSCVLVLFSLIDAKIIRLQRKEDRDSRGRRKTGLTAAKKLFIRINAETNIEKKLFTLLCYENVFACLNTVFADGEDFKNQPVVINRNFLDHGMMTRPVIRKDCVQLFLLCYNLFMLLELIY